MKVRELLSINIIMLKGNFNTYFQFASFGSSLTSKYAWKVLNFPLPYLE